MAANQAQQSDRIKALLTEYTACNETRTHYDSVRWTIGSIFVAGSFVLLGASFQSPVTSDKLSVIFLSVLSFLLFLVWFAYQRHVQPWIKYSMDRSREIEVWLYSYGIDLRLSRTLSTFPRGEGRAITYSLLALVLAAAIARILIAIL